MTRNGGGGKKPSVRYPGRVMGVLLLTFVLPSIVVTYLMQPRLSIWTFVPGVLGGRSFSDGCISSGGARDGPARIVLCRR